eukprot:TRINITY_DN1576_c0_g1_i1.p1 TRINITY_DN1576_c0_g1~~TRINITY_DN1576_c0_g1_i1.p1  ORF type:complete len:283 (-),score=77.39 TRINITY_DN1576_c0_g1_i1:195-1022(-)
MATKDSSTPTSEVAATPAPATPTPDVPAPAAPATDVAEVAQPVSKKRKLTKYHRVRAHANPLSDHPFDYPSTPDAMDWSLHYPNFSANDRKVEFCDIGCGYGGLSVSLSQLFPEKYIVAMEIRPSVVEYVADRIKKLREAEEGKYTNVSVIQTNAMKYLPNFFLKGQLQKMFFLFPDPHFKKSKHRLRIINNVLLAEYAYLIAIGGKLYTISDVKDLAEWMQKHLDEHPLFEKVSDEENSQDPTVPLVRDSSEEAKKVARNGGDKYLAVYRRIAA